jgi:hypothetical protein
MANVFDQFDNAAPPAEEPNVFDQFDVEAPVPASANVFDQFDTSATVDPAPAAPDTDNFVNASPAPSVVAPLPTISATELRAYDPPSLPRRALTAAREALSPLLGPTENQRLRRDFAAEIMARDFPALTRAAESSTLSKVETEGFIPALFTPTEGSPLALPMVAPSAERGAVGQVAAGGYNTVAGAVNSMTSSPGGLLSLAAAPAMMASRAATGLFAADMGRQTVENVPRTLATVADPEASVQQKTEAIAGTALTAALTGAGARAALRSPDVVAPRAVAEPAKVAEPAAVARAAEPAPAPVAPAAEVVTPRGVEAVSSRDMPGAVRAAMEAEPAPSVAGPRPAPAGEVKPLGLLESARRADTVVDPVKAQLEGDYTVARNAETVAEANRRIDAASSLDDARRTVMDAENPDAVTNAMGIELVRKYQDSGRFADAAEVLNHMAVKAKTQGQAIQILSTLSRSTPEGAAAYAQRLFGRQLTPEEFAGIRKDFDWVQAATDPSVRAGRQAIMLGRLQERIPIGLDAKLNAARNMAMLLNPKTQIRNVVGNVFMASADLAADVIAMPADMGVSVFTGKRTVSGPQLIEYTKGLATPFNEFSAAYKQARSEGLGVIRATSSAADVVNALTKLGDTSKMELADVKRAYRLTFSNPLMRGMEKTLGLAMGVPDRAFYMARLRGSLNSMMRAADAVVPTAEMLERASLEAARSTYQDRNFISTALGEVRKGMNFGSTFGRSSTFGAGSVVLPFTQVPGALLLRGAEFSPAGFVRTLAEAAIPVFTKRAFNQREFVQSFSKALAGTGGLAAVGYWLNSLGVITGAPNEDKEVANLERNMGMGAYKINVSEMKRRLQSMDWTSPGGKGPQPGDTFVNYDWVQPLALPVALGADFNATKGVQGDTNPAGRVLRALASGTRTLEEQPLLTGLTGFAAQVAYAREGQGSMVDVLGQTMLDLPTSFVPTAIRQMRDLVDNRVYETRGSEKMEKAYRDALASLPGVAERMGYKPRVDMLGTPLERYQGGENTFFNVVINPAMVTSMKRDPMLRELYGIWQQTGETGQLPNQVRATITINGEKRGLTAPERADYQQFVGRLSREGFRLLMTAPGYANAQPADKAKVLSQFVSAADLAARVSLFGYRPKSGSEMDALAILMSRANGARLTDQNQASIQ